MKTLRALIIGGLFGFVASAGCSSGPAPCQSSCDGCCDLNNVCQVGNTAAACGEGAHQCARCGTSGACVDHACVTTDGGIKDAGTGGGGDSTGGGSGGGGTGGGDVDAGNDGGDMVIDSGVVLYEPDAGTFNLSFGNCGSFVPCGGNPLGIWTYSSCCIPDTDFQAMITKSDQYCGMGSTSISNKAGSAYGWMGFDGVNARHVVHGYMAFTANINGAICSQPFACAQISGNLASIGIQGTCSVVNGVCVCNLSGGIEVDDSSAYTYSGHTVTLTDANKTFDFCAGPNKLIMRETTASSSTKEPGYPNAARQPSMP